MAGRLLQRVEDLGLSNWLLRGGAAGVGDAIELSHANVAAGGQAILRDSFSFLSRYKQHVALTNDWCRQEAKA